VTGRGDTPYVNVVPRVRPHGQRVKSGLPRRIYVTDRVDRLYGEYLWQLCDGGADVALGDMDSALVFVNLNGGERFAPWQPGSVYSLVDRLKRELKHNVPARWTPHWFRHTHATALLLAGVPLHVVSRRLGHADVQTTMNLYGWVTDDAELRAAADWQRLIANWEQRDAAQ
jgi:integrase